MSNTSEYIDMLVEQLDSYTSKCADRMRDKRNVFVIEVNDVIHVITIKEEKTLVEFKELLDITGSSLDIGILGIISIHSVLRDIVAECDTFCDTVDFKLDKDGKWVSHDSTDKKREFFIRVLWEEDGVGRNCEAVYRVMTLESITSDMLESSLRDIGVPFNSLVSSMNPDLLRQELGIESIEETHDACSVDFSIHSSDDWFDGFKFED